MPGRHKHKINKKHLVKQASAVVAFLFISGFLSAQFFSKGKHVLYPELSLATSVPVNHLLSEFRFDGCEWTGDTLEVINWKYNDPYVDYGHGMAKGLIGLPRTGQGIACKAGDFRDFSNSDAYYVEVTSPLFSGVTTFTVAFWFKGENTLMNQMLAAGENTYSTEHRIWYSGNTIYTILENNQSSPSTYTPSGGISAGSWNHVVWIRNGLNQSLYFNGTLVANTTNTTLTDPTPTSFNYLMMGAASKDPAQAGNDFEGLMDEVKLFDSPLLGSEVTEIFNNESSPPLKNSDASLRTCSNCNLYGDWYFDNCYYEAGVDVLTDYSGNGSYGTVSQAPIAANGQLCRSTMLNQGAYFTVNNPIMDNIESAVGISVWVYPFSGAERTIISKGSHTAGRGFRLALDSSNRIKWTVNDTSQTSLNALPLQVWSHIFVSFDNVTNLMKIYRDGQPVKSDTYSENAILQDNFNLFIGTDSVTIGVYDKYFYGRLDEMRIYNESLNDDQVETIYEYQRNQLDANGNVRNCFDCVPSPLVDLSFDNCGTYAGGVNVQDKSAVRWR